MSPKYAIQFGLMAIAALLAADFGATALTWRIVLACAAIAFALVAIAYALGRPGLLMKRNDGSQPAFAWLILWPYFLLARLSFLSYRLSHRGAVAVGEVLPGIWFSRRLTKPELLESKVASAAVLDLAAEFSRMSSNSVAYRSVPMLDGAVPTEAQLRDAVAWIDEQAGRGNVLVHCALGHGRTGVVMLAWLLWHGHFPDVKAAIAHLRARRTTFGMSKVQVAFVERLTARSQI